MDGSTVDRLIHAVGSSSRRLALRTALGSVAVATGLLAAALDSDAKKRKRKKCKKCRGRAQGETCTTNKDCCANETRLACALPNISSFVARCCGANGGPCDDSGDCCIGLSCGLTGQCEVDI